MTNLFGLWAKIDFRVMSEVFRLVFKMHNPVGEIHGDLKDRDRNGWLGILQVLTENHARWCPGDSDRDDQD